MAGEHWRSLSGGSDFWQARFMIHPHRLFLCFTILEDLHVLGPHFFSLHCWTGDQHMLRNALRLEAYFISLPLALARTRLVT